ncbi:unnamed protein product [Zymoseptoria tritici ST99CH_3D7]|uniref:Uncharacterized protein n=1 Tax=Zymoseptoria tritici (strain ST99CH_3D7) TaxID=1276538 RepID=A0A1X7RN62_ZYMT9|nr:unnamed protein product [Zymoseptoria tritici ST99CH_3D7]
MIPNRPAWNFPENSTTLSSPGACASTCLRLPAMKGLCRIKVPKRSAGVPVQGTCWEEPSSDEHVSDRADLGPRRSMARHGAGLRGEALSLIAWHLPWHAVVCR